jgi:hypothetical protein
MNRNKTVIAICKHFGKRFVWRIETDYASEVLRLPKGIYEILDWPLACTGRQRQPKYQYISTLKRFCPVVGGKGCKSYIPQDPPKEFLFDGKALHYRWIGPLGDPDAEEEAARIGNISVL